MGFDVDTSHFTYAQYGIELYRRYDSLAMTLESGLDLLRGLTVELRSRTGLWSIGILRPVGITDYRTDGDNEEFFNGSAYEPDSDDEDTKFDSEEEDEEEEKEGEFGDKKG
ncbi:hypothetical protein BGX24_005473 [Mortierella sp. AD032]|nr:hypothetical protein BGX24_005473 [Mortierella sp. AD032]